MRRTILAEGGRTIIPRKQFSRIVSALRDGQRVGIIIYLPLLGIILLLLPQIVKLVQMVDIGIDDGPFLDILAKSVYGNSKVLLEVAIFAQIDHHADQICAGYHFSGLPLKFLLHGEGSSSF